MLHVSKIDCVSKRIKCYHSFLKSNCRQKRIYRQVHHQVWHKVIIIVASNPASCGTQTTCPKHEAKSFTNWKHFQSHQRKLNVAGLQRGVAFLTSIWDLVECHVLRIDCNQHERQTYIYKCKVSRGMQGIPLTHTQNMCLILILNLGGLMFSVQHKNNY